MRCSLVHKPPQTDCSAVDVEVNTMFTFPAPHLLRTLSLTGFSEVNIVFTSGQALLFALLHQPMHGSAAADPPADGPRSPQEVPCGR